MLLSHIKKDGYLLIMTLFQPEKKDDFLKWFYIKDATHIGFFTEKTFNYLASQYNLEIIKSNKKNSILFKVC